MDIIRFAHSVHQDLVGIVDDEKCIGSCVGGMHERITESTCRVGHKVDLTLHAL